MPLMWRLVLAVSSLVFAAVMFSKLNKPGLIHCFILTIRTKATTVTIPVIVLHHFLKRIFTSQFFMLLNDGNKSKG